MQRNPEGLGIGERIAWYRRRRGISQEALAGLVGRTTDWLSKVENGRIGLDRLSVLRALAEALGVRLDALLAEPTAHASSSKGLGDSVSRLRETLTDYQQISAFLTVDEKGAAMDLCRLRADVGDAWSAYQHGRYGHAARLLSGTLTETQQAVRLLEGDRRRRAKALLALSYQGAAMVLTKVGETGLAWMAADRGLNAAQESGDPMVLGSLSRSVSHCLLANDRIASACDLVTASADFLEGGAADASPTRLSLYGTLLLVGAMAAARLEDRSAVDDFLAEADRTAVRLGQDANHMWTAFGPTNVAIHRVSTSMELGDVQLAAAQGSHVNASALPLERRVRHALEVARAYNAVNRSEEALSLLLDAEKLAPEQVRHHFIPRALVTTWLRRRRGKPSHLLAGVAQRLGVVG
ncbi:helix-turn-helix transcriptional regulator [Nocardiopsis sp. CNT-189]|uniref:helix-turn-helix domain-containing protein n=1 Tax=Nocardiopsis oceanisediminis TaxID=2816862 RepID=UPI003B310C8F